MKRLTAACVFASALAILTVDASLGGQTAQPAVKRAALAKLAEPWPDTEELRELRIEAESRPLFVGVDPIPLTLTADFKAINKDRRPEGKKDYPAALAAPGSGGAANTLA